MGVREAPGSGSGLSGRVAREELLPKATTRSKSWLTALWRRLGRSPGSIGVAETAHQGSEDGNDVSRDEPLRVGVDDLKVLQRIPALLDLPARTAIETLSDPALFVVRIYLSAVLRLAREASHGAPSPDRFTALAVDRETRYASTVDSFREDYKRICPVLRTLAWALSGDGRPRLRVHFAVGAPPEDIEAVLEEAHPPGTGDGYIWWLLSDEPPRALVERCTGRDLVFIASRLPTGLVGRDSRVLLDVNRAVVVEELVEDDDHATGVVMLPAAAAFVQGLLFSAKEGGWFQVQPPGGYHGLEHDVLLDEALALFASGAVTPILADATGERLLVPTAWLSEAGRRRGSGRALIRFDVSADRAGGEVPESSKELGEFSSGDR